MAFELRQQLKISQQLVMTPQLQQAIRLLQLSRIELVETINQEMEQNPVLEEATDEEWNTSTSVDAEPEVSSDEIMPSLSSNEAEQTPWEEKALKEVEWSEYLDEDYRSSLPSYTFEEKEVPNYENTVSGSADLGEHLIWQLQMSRLTKTERDIGCLIIGNLNKNGYLVADLEELAKEADCPLEEAERVLKQIQLFDPVGVAARDLRECLLIQLEYLNVTDPLVIKIVDKYLPYVERHNYQAIAKATKRTVEEVAAAIQVITGLDPRPGRAYSKEDVQYIVPDIYVYKVDDEYVVSLNEEDLPRLKISQYYKDTLSNPSAPSQTREFIQNKLKSAVWLIKSIHQRQKTIYKVTQSIVKFQKDFLDFGISYLKPLVLRDVAEDVGMHESTISRVTTNKYVHTPQGIFELKFFFSTGLSRKDGHGAEIAAQSVKEKIKQLVQSEDPSKPYSDKQIVEILAKDNIKIARRTVAKYRDLLGILPSSRRKRPKLK